MRLIQLLSNFNRHATFIFLSVRRLRQKNKTIFNNNKLMFVCSLNGNFLFNTA